MKNLTLLRLLRDRTAVGLVAILITGGAAVAEPQAKGVESSSDSTQVSQSDAESSDPLFIEPVDPTEVLPPEDEVPEPVFIEPGETEFTEAEPALEIDTVLDEDPEVAEIPTVEFEPLESIEADGRSTVMIRGKVLNPDGSPFEDDVVVTLTSGAGLFVGDDADEERSGFQVVAKDGSFATRLRAPIKAQWTRIRASIDPVFDLKLPLEEIPDSFSSLALPTAPYRSTREPLASEAYADLEFTPFLRPSLVSGSLDLRLGQGTTDFFGSFADFLDPDGDDDFTVDLDGGVFATGAVGNWLFTGAFNVDRGLNDDCDGPRLFRDFNSNCENQIYPVFGDSSTVDFLTPSRDSIYARFERQSSVPGAEVDYFQWGDWDTAEFSRRSQLFSATDRILHGAKLNYTLGGFQFTGAYANSVQGFRRDTIALNGTSGIFFLSNRLVFPGSEVLSLEVEEFNRPGVVVERRLLRRNLDYEIDYDRGSITFRRSVLGTEFDPFGTTLVRRVVATYQFEDAGESNTGLFGGRLQYNFSRDPGEESWLGVTYINEDQGDLNFQLIGTDVYVPLGRFGALTAEYAYSDNGLTFSGITEDDEFDGDVSGNAYRVEIEGRPIDAIRARAYYRSAEEGFVNDATASYVPGQTRYGVEGSAQVGETTQLSFGFDREENFGSEVSLEPRFFDIFDPNPEFFGGDGVANSLTTFRGGIIQKLGSSDLSVEYVNRSRDDDAGTSLSTDSSQIVSKVRVPLNEKLAFRAQNEASLGDVDELYPNRTTLAVEWDAYPGVKLRLGHQFFGGGITEDSAITSLDTITNFPLGPNTDLTSRYSILGTRNGLNNFGSVGLNHRWKVSPGFRVNLGYERIFDDLFNRTGAGDREETAFAVGQTASVLGLSEGATYSVGFDYTGSDTFKGSGRFEFRDAEGSDLFFSTLGGAGKVSDSLSVLGRLEFSGASNQTFIGRVGDVFNGRLGLAYRNPLSDRFNGLFRVEHRVNGDNTPNDIGTGSESRDTVLSTELIYAPNWRWEFYGKYAARWAETKLRGGFSNSTFLSLAQLRALYRFDYRWDAAIEGRLINQTSANFDEFGIAAEVGYHVTPDLRAYLGYSFGSVDDRDFSGFRSEGGVYGGLNLKVNRLFSDFGVQQPVPRAPQESAAEATPPVADDPFVEPIEAVEGSEESAFLFEGASLEDGSSSESLQPPEAVTESSESLEAEGNESASL